MSDYLQPQPATDEVLASARTLAERGEPWTCHTARAVLARLDAAEGRFPRRTGRGPGQIGREVLALLRRQGRPMSLDELERPELSRYRLSLILERMERRGWVRYRDYRWAAVTEVAPLPEAI
jgi:hypothetical protein